MLTKRLTKFLLKRLLGKYIVCDLDLDQLDVELRTGLIHLKDIDLGIDAINDLLGSLPIRIKSGFARSVTVQLPYTHIWASNFKCRLELNYLEIAFTTNDRSLSPDNPSSKLVSSLLSDLDKSKLESESESSDEDDEFADGSEMALEGVEELTKLLQKLFIKVSAAINCCVLLFDFYSHERGKDVRLMLTIKSLEYGSAEGSAEMMEKTVKIKDYKVELLEREHKTVENEEQEEEEEDETFTERSVILEGGGEMDGIQDYVRLQMSTTHGLTGVTCELHQLAGTLSSKQLTPLLEAASVFSRKPPPLATLQTHEGEARLGSSLPESFRPSSLEKDLKVGSFEKSLSPNDLRAIHEMLNNQRNSRSSSSLAKLEAEVAEREKEKAEKEKADKEKVSSLLSEEDSTLSTLSDDSDDDLFFECNDDIPGVMASSLKDNKKEVAQPPEFHAVINLHSGNITLTDSETCCKLIWTNMKLSHTPSVTSLTFSTFHGEEGKCGGELSPLFFFELDEDPAADIPAFAFTVAQTKKELNVQLDFQPLSLNLDRDRISRISSLASSYLGRAKEVAQTVTSWKPNLSKPPTPVQSSPSPSPSPPISPHDLRNARPPSSFPHNIPGRANSLPPQSTSPHVSPHSVSPRNYMNTSALPQSFNPIRATPPQSIISMRSTSPQTINPMRSTPPQAIVPIRSTPPQTLALRGGSSLPNSFPRNKVSQNPPQSHNLLSYTNSPLQNDSGFGPPMDGQLPTVNFYNTSIPHGITIPMSMAPQPISGFLPSSSPAGRTYHHEYTEDQSTKRQVTITCPTLFINIMLPGIYEGSKIRVSASNTKFTSCTFSKDDPSTPVKWYLDIHTLDAWLHTDSNTMYPLFEAQLHNTGTEGEGLMPIEITLRPRPLEVNYAWPSSFDEDDTELHELFRHKAMESAQTVVQMVLPHTRIDISKKNYDTLLSVIDVFSGGKEDGAEKPVRERMDHSGHVTRTTQLALVVFITHGSWTFRESPPSPAEPSSPSLSSALPPAARAHELEFDGFKLVHVVQNVEYSEKRVGPLSGYDTISRSASFTAIVADNITLRSSENNIENIIFARTPAHTAKSVFRAGFSTDSMKTINLAFRGITINHFMGADWIPRLVDFFTPSSPSSPTIEPSVEQSPSTPPNPPSGADLSAPEPSGPGTQLHVDFDEVSVLYTPPHPLTSRLVLFVEDLRLHVLEFSPLSMNLQSNHWKVLLWDGMGIHKDTLPWHDGYVTVISHNGLELNISKSPSFELDITFQELLVDVCEDSFHVLLELVSNYLGLDIPLAGVADLIVQEGQDLELSEVLADALEEASLGDSTGSQTQRLYPTLDELKNPHFSPTITTTTSNNNNNNNNNTSNNKSNNTNTTKKTEETILQGSFGLEKVRPRRKCIVDEDEDDFDDVNTLQSIKPTKNSVNTSNNLNRSTNSNSTMYSSKSNVYDDEEDGMFEEVNQMGSDNEEKSSLNNSVSSDLTSSSSLSNSMVGSRIIDDYDPDDRDVQDENVIYVEVVPSAAPLPSPSASSRKSPELPSVPIIRWLEPEERINIIENYIDTLPPPSDTIYSLPRDYPPSVARVAVRALSAILRFHAGSHWPNIPSAEPFLVVKLMDLVILQDTFAPKGPQATRLVVSLTDIEITDHVPTSVWHLFLCYDVDVPRMRGSPIILLELDSVRPDPQSILEEFRLRLSILPLRFNVDQDAVQFIMKFLLSGKKAEKEHGDPNKERESAKPTKSKRSGSMTTTPAKAQEMMFFQSCEIKPLRIKVDYKPKRVDYRSLKKGNLAELLNLFHLEGAVFHLTRIKANGLAGFAGIAKSVGDVWIPHIINTQMYNYVAGVRGIRSLVHVGEGVADLVLLPLEGYRKDGKIIQGLKKGSSSFLNALALETLHLGSQVAAGTQNFLESATSMMFAGTPSVKLASPAAVKYVSKLAAQPEDTREGIAHALQSVKREFRTAAQTIIAVPIEEYSRAGPQGAVRSVIRAVPVAILRPVIGLTEGISKVALGVRNDIAPDALKTDLKNKYKQ